MTGAGMREIATRFTSNLQPIEWIYFGSRLLFALFLFTNRSAINRLLREMKPTGQWFSCLLKGLVIISALITLIALGFLPASYHRNNSTHWPTASGVVTNVGLKAHLQKPRRPAYFTPVVSYTYTVQGAPRTGTRIDFADAVLVFQKDEALAWIDRNYPVGKQVTVYYDPKDPALAVLVPGATDLLWICWLSSAYAALCCVASLVILNRQKNKLPETSPATEAPRTA
jgi:hypothetical protein